MSCTKECWLHWDLLEDPQGTEQPLPEPSQLKALGEATSHRCAQPLEPGEKACSEMGVTQRAQVLLHGHQPPLHPRNCHKAGGNVMRKG